MSKRAIVICEKSILPRSTRERFLPLESPAGRRLAAQGLLLAGVSSCGKGFEIGRVDAPFHLLLFTVAGRGLLVTREGQRLLRPGDLMVCPAHRSDHVHATRGVHWKHLFLRLEENRLWAGLQRYPGIIVSPGHRTADLEHAMDRFIYESMSQRSDSAAVASQYAELILAYLEREISFLGSRKDQELRERLDRLWQSVDSDLGKSWTLADLAAQGALSRSHLTRLSLRFFKRSPMQMVAHLRMARAQSLLAHTEMPLAQIAEVLGYSNQFAFSVAFSRHVGHSPSAHRGATRAAGAP
jgi:AraC-like DNA-binding protein